MKTQALIKRLRAQLAYLREQKEAHERSAGEACENGWPNTVLYHLRRAEEFRVLRSGVLQALAKLEG